MRVRCSNWIKGPEAHEETLQIYLQALCIDYRRNKELQKLETVVFMKDRVLNFRP